MELDSMRQQLSANKPALGFASEAREDKMKELARRAKAATMALGRERAKTASLMAEVAQLKQSASDAAASGAAAGGTAAGTAAARLESASARVGDARDGVDSGARERELKEAKERLAAANARLHEAKVSGQTAKSELVKYQRALLKEVGDDTSIARLLEEGSGAKGRAQQISLLKDQVKDLQRRLASAHGEEAVPGSPANRGEQLQRGAIEHIEADRRREMERLLVREQELSGEVVESRKRVEAMGARIRNLELDVRGKKEKLKTLLDKSETDDALVTALRAELDKQRRNGGKGGGSSSGGGGGGEGLDAATLRKRMSELASKNAQQQTQIDRQEQIILALRDQLQNQPEPKASARPPQDLIKLQAENSKLRELVGLLQEKLAEAAQADSY